MNALQVDPVTGFMESPGNAAYGFTADKKVKFLELAKQYRADGKFPSVSGICAAIGINFSTFERHLSQDPQFQAIWKEITSDVEYECIGDMHDLRKKNPMYMFGLLRYLNPKRWNPNEKQETTLNINVFNEAIKELPRYQEAAIVERSPAIAPQSECLPSTSELPARDLTGGDK